MVALGERMKYLRTKNHLQQEQVACLLGTDQSNVSQWEDGLSDPPCRILIRIANLYGVTTDYLLGQVSDQFSESRNDLNIQLSKHRFSDYALNWFEIYSKPNVETVTGVTYKRQITKYLIPSFGELNVENITTDHIQQLFNDMDTSKATKEKVRIVLNQILDAAVEDELLVKNPLKSNRIRITGEISKPTKVYSIEQMRYLVQHIDCIRQSQDRTYLAVQALHPLRLEEVLGLKWSDVDMEHKLLYINRAVTHPTRNQPEIKRPKTNSSIRVIGLSSLALQYLFRGPNDDFVLGGKSPLSYTQVRRMCNRIKSDTGFDENITPIRFRTTVLTDLYDQTKDIKLAQAAAGHTTAAMTLKYYVKGRESTTQTATVIDNAYYR